ncbi:MAG TPA: EVE domain-containing protein [Myxococcales bacterium]
MNYWLLKTEPGSFSFDDLWKAPRRTTGWGGVRNYQARNTLRDEMKKGDLALIYHSNADPSAVIGIGEVVREGHPDPTQFDASDDHYDPDSPPDAPRWFQVSVKAVRKLKRPVSLEEIKANEALSGMLLVQRSRLSVQNVSKEDFEAIVRLGG